MENGLILMGDLPRKKNEVWSHYTGWPSHVERIWKSGLVVMGDLPKWKTNVKCGLIVMGDLPIWKEYEKVVSLWWATYPNRKNMKCGLIVMGRSQMEKKHEEVWSHCHGWPTQMEDVIWQVWKIGLTGEVFEGMTEEGLENLVLPDNSRS